jgi:hypothetical protein
MPCDSNVEVFGVVDRPRQTWLQLVRGCRRPKWSQIDGGTLVKKGFFTTSGSKSGFVAEVRLPEFVLRRAGAYEEVAD